MTEHGKISLETLQALKQAERKFSVLTCYDACVARFCQEAGVEVLLVGDSAAEVVLGLPNTREMPVEFSLAITAAVRRGAPQVFLMADLPFGCRCDDLETTTRWCQRYRDETGCDAIKVEVTAEETPLITAIRDAGVPVVAHIGLLPQLVDAKSGYRARGREAEDAWALLEQARALEAAGASLLLLEAVASEVADIITRRVGVPIIGCASGPHCDGTVVVLHDMLGLGGGHRPRGIKQYEHLAEALQRAFTAYADDIHAGRFPVEANAIHMKPGEAAKFAAQLG